MFNADVIARAALAVVLLASVSALIAAMLHRRWRAHLSRLASRHSLSLTSGPCPAKYIELSGRYRAGWSKAAVSGLMLGATGDGMFCATRRMGRIRQQLLYFELEGSAHLDRFFIVPEKDKGAEKVRFVLHWCASKAEWSDERALSMSARVMYGVSSLGTRGEQPRLGVELQGSKVWIHSLGNVRGKDLDRFLDDSMRLRQILHKSLERTNGIPRRTRNSASIPVSVPVERVSA
jgi:hypothetical protein